MKPQTCKCGCPLKDHMHTKRGYRGRYAGQKQGRCKKCRECREFKQQS